MSRAKLGFSRKVRLRSPVGRAPKEHKNLLLEAVKWILGVSEVRLEVVDVPLSGARQN